MTVPADAPVKLHWSATAYDRATHALIRDMPHSSRAATTPGPTVVAPQEDDIVPEPAEAGATAGASQEEA